MYGFKCLSLDGMATQESILQLLAVKLASVMQLPINTYRISITPPAMLCGLRTTRSSRGSSAWLVLALFRGRHTRRPHLHPLRLPFSHLLLWSALLLFLRGCLLSLATCLFVLAFVLFAQSFGFEFVPVAVEF